VGDVGDEGSLHFDESVLLGPVDENNGGAGENQGEKDSAFHEREPSQTIGFDLRSEALGHFPQLRMLFKIPADPHNHQKDPEDLDGEENGNRMVEPLRSELDALYHNLRPLCQAAGKIDKVLAPGGRLWSAAACCRF
jgi:hypothetical protein